MRIIGLFTMCLWLGACTTAPLFPPEIMKDVKMDTVAFKAWKNQSYHSSTANVVSHKVELGGQILNVIRKPQGVVILAEEQPIDSYLGYGPTRVRREGAFKFAIDLKSVPDADMLRAGDQLAVVGALDSSSLEVIDGMPKVLPHLRSQCLHIWKTQGFETDFTAYESAGYYPLKKRTYCLEEDKEGTLSSGDGQGDMAKGSAGS